MITLEHVFVISKIFVGPMLSLYCCCCCCCGGGGGGDGDGW